MTVTVQECDRKTGSKGECEEEMIKTWWGIKMFAKGQKPLSGAIISVYITEVEGISEECLNKNTQYLLLRIFFFKKINK